MIVGNFLPPLQVFLIYLFNFSLAQRALGRLGVSRKRERELVANDSLHPSLLCNHYILY